MHEKYFKLRKKWRVRKNRFDLGPMFTINPIHISGYFVMRIFSLKEKEYLPFYHYHLADYLIRNPNGTEETFLAIVLEIVDKDKKSRETLYYYDTLSKTRIYKLSRFREALKEVDKWGLTLTNEERLRQSVSYVKEIMNWQSVNDTKSVLSKLLFDEVGSDQFFIEYKRIIEERNYLERQLDKKKEEYKNLQEDFNKWVPKQKILIHNGDTSLLTDLFIQINNLCVPGTDKSFLHADPLVWAAFLCNNFEFKNSNVDKGGNPKNLKWDTVRDHFYGKHRTKAMKLRFRDKFFNIKEHDGKYT